MKTPYNHADKALKVLNDTMGREFQNMSVSLRFDELNVIEVKKQVGAMYTRINRAVKCQFGKVAQKVFEDTEKELGVAHTEFAGMGFVLALLKRYDPVTKYVYTSEWMRKRDRLVESIMASEGRRELRQALKRALDLMALQVRQYADNLTDETRNEVFERAGVDEVRWNTQRDARVCGECADRDGMIYPIDAVPCKHYRCRCYLTAVHRT